VVRDGFVVESGTAILLISVSDPVGSLAWEIRLSNRQAEFRAVTRRPQA
jgi:hypothetical protein